MNGLSNGLKRHSKWMFWLGISMILWVMILFLYHWWPASGKAMVEYYDGQSQHFVAFVYFGKYAREILSAIFVHHSLASIPTFSFSIGYGQDIIGTLSYYIIGDPFSIFSILATPQHAEFAYSLAIMVRVYCAGLAFSLYTRTHHAAQYQSVIGTLVYVFAAFIISAASRHPYFTNALIYLPLLAIGVDRLFNGKGWKWLTFTTFIVVMSNFYFFYMLTVLIFLYGIYQYLQNYRNVWSFKQLGLRFLQVCGTYMLGVAMAAVLLVPILYQFFAAGRSSIRPVIELLYPKQFYLDLPNTLIAPVYGAQFWTLAAFLPIVVVIFAAIIVRMFQKDRSALIDFIGIMCLTAMMLFPIVGSVMNGMSYSTNRWIFGFDFYWGLLTVKYLPWLVEKWRDQRENLSFITLVVFLVIAFLFRANTKQIPTAFVGLIFAVGYLVVVLMSPNIKLTKWLLVGLTIINVLVYCNYSANTRRFPSKLNGYTNAHIVKNDYYAYKSQAIADQMKRDGSWSRYELANENYRAELNNALIHNIPSTNFYFSLSNASVFAFNKQIANNIRDDFEYFGVDNRAELDMLQNVKYYAILKGENKATIPFGFKRFKRVNVDHHVVFLYRNQNWLPFGYTYDRYARQNDSTDANTLMATMPKTAVTTESLKGLKSASLTRTGFTKLDAKVTATDGVRIQGNQYLVSKANGSVTFSTAVPAGSQLFAELKGINFGNEKTGHFGTTNTEALLSWQYGDLTKTFDYRNTYQFWYAGITNSVLNMGNGQRDKTVSLTFSKPGSYSFKAVSLFARDYSKLNSQTRALKRSTLQDVQFNPNQVQGNIQLNQTKLLAMTIPFGAGWTAYDNGQKIQIHKINLMSSGLLLKPGSHHIVLRYQTPGLKAGLIISVMAWLVFACIWILSRHQHRQFIAQR